MISASKKSTTAKLRSWRVITIRSKGEYLGSVEAPDRERAEAVAIKQFELDDGSSQRSAGKPRAQSQRQMSGLSFWPGPEPGTF